MQTTYNTTIHLSSADCERIIKEYFRSTQALDVSSITFDITKEICGMGTNEHECTTFKGVTVRCDKSAIDSWKGEVDRQSGAFTQEEIDNSTAWK